MHYICPNCDLKIESDPSKAVVHSCVPSDKEIGERIEKKVETNFIHNEHGVFIGESKTVIEKKVPVIRKANVSLRGTFESFETANNSANQLVQIKIVRKYEKGKLTITITESTPSEIETHLKKCKEEALKAQS